MIFQRGRYTTDQYRYHPSPNPTRLGRTVGGPRLLARWRVPVSSPRRISRTRRRKHVREFVGKNITKICMWIVIIYMDDDLYTKLYIYHILYIYHYIIYIYTVYIYYRHIFVLCLFDEKFKPCFARSQPAPFDQWVAFGQRPWPKRRLTSWVILEVMNHKDIIWNYNPHSKIQQNDFRISHWMGINCSRYITTLIGI